MDVNVSGRRRTAERVGCCASGAVAALAEAILLSGPALMAVAAVTTTLARSIPRRLRRRWTISAKVGRRAALVAAEHRAGAISQGDHGAFPPVQLPCEPDRTEGAPRA